MRLPLFILAGLLCCALGVARGLEPLKQPLAVPAEAGAAVNGMKLAVKAAPEAWYPVGDPITLQLAMQNVGDKALSLEIDSCCSFYGNTHVVDENGIPCDNQAPMAFAKHPGASWITVKAGGETAMDEEVTQYVSIAKPGTYTIWFTFTMRDGARPQDGMKVDAPSWHGTLVSNLVKVTVISQEEYARRAGGPVADGKYKGLSLTLAATKPAFRLGEILMFQVTLKNASKQAMQVPFDTSGRLYRLTDDGQTIQSRARIYGSAEAAIPAIALQPGEEKTVDVSSSNLHISEGLVGDYTYRADFWVQQPSTAAKVDGTPQTPLRTVSNAVPVRIELAEADVDRLLNAAVQEGKSGRGYRYNSQAVRSLCAVLDQIAPWLPARATGQSDEAQLAGNLLLAAQMKPVLQGERPASSFTIDAKGMIRLQPAALGALVNLPETADATAAAKAYVRLKLSASLLSMGSSDSISADPQTPVAVIKALVEAVRATADAERIYVYRMQVKLPEEINGGTALDFTTTMACSLLIGLEEVNGRPTYYVTPYPDPDPRPNYFRGWDQKAFKQALDALPTSTLRFTSFDDFQRYIAGREKRHEQIYLVPLAGVKWGQCVEAAKAIRAWNEQSPVGIYD